MFARNIPDETLLKRPQPRDENRIVLTEAGWEDFLAVLDNPPAPSEALREAYRKYREKYGSS